MKILLINNNTAHLQALHKALSGHDVEVQKYHPGLAFHYYDKDLIILSGGGGEGLEIDDTDERGRLWYEDEMKFVRSCQKPLLGVCMGFEVMAKAYGQPVFYLGQTVSQTAAVETTKKGWRLFGQRTFRQVESHSWGVPEAPEGFEALMRSENGLEMMYSSYRQQLGTQFHPELGGSLSMDKLIYALQS